MRQFLAALSNMPHLEVLNFRDALMAGTTASAVPVHPISLSYSYMYRVGHSRLCFPTQPSLLPFDHFRHTVLYDYVPIHIRDGRLVM
jgi:hypothetical protein